MSKIAFLLITIFLWALPTQSQERIPTTITIGEVLDEYSAEIQTTVIAEYLKDLEPDLYDPNTRVTLFAPVDSVWDAAEEIVSEWKEKDLFNAFLSNLVIDGLYRRVDLVNDFVFSTHTPGSWIRVNQYSDTDLLYLNGKVGVLMGERRQRNGYLYLVDSIIVPSTFDNNNNQNIFNYISSQDQYTMLTEVLFTKPALMELLDSDVLSSGNAFTFFAPNNDAFTESGFTREALLSPINDIAVENLILYHLVKSTYYLVGLESQELPTLLSANNVTISSVLTSTKKRQNGNVRINGVPLSSVEQSLRNGVVHEISTLLVPQDFELEEPAQEPEPFQPEPEVYQPEPEVYQPEPEPFQPEPEVYQPEPEVYQPEPEPVQPEPEVYQPEPEVYQPEPEPVQPEPEVYQPEPEAYQPEPEPFQPEPEVYQPEPEVYQPEPEVYQPEPEPEPYQPEPEVYQPEPEVYQPEPEVYQPEPEVYQPEPEVYQPEPEVYQPEPEVYQPEPEVYQPEPEPEPVQPEPEPYQPEPEVYQPEPEVYQPEPEPVQPEPEVYQPEPEVYQPEPEVYQPEPEPEVYQPEPEVYQPEPEVYQPEPEPVQPEPEVYQPEPEVYQPEPEVYQPEPEPVQPEPVVYQPEPEVYQPEPEPEPVQPEPEVYQPEPEIYEPEPEQLEQPEPQPEQEVVDCYAINSCEICQRYSQCSYCSIPPTNTLPYYGRCVPNPVSPTNNQTCYTLGGRYVEQGQCPHTKQCSSISSCSECIAEPQCFYCSYGYRRGCYSKRDTLELQQCQRQGSVISKNCPYGF